MKFFSLKRCCCNAMNSLGIVRAADESFEVNFWEHSGDRLKKCKFYLECTEQEIQDEKNDKFHNWNFYLITEKVN